MSILICPVDRHFPLELHVFEEDEHSIITGLIVCPKCLRWYPIRERVPEMLVDDLRDKEDNIQFLSKWKKHIPEQVLLNGKPYNLS